MADADTSSHIQLVVSTSEALRGRTLAHCWVNLFSFQIGQKRKNDHLLKDFLASGKLLYFFLSLTVESKTCLLVVSQNKVLFTVVVLNLQKSLNI